MKYFCLKVVTQHTQQPGCQQTDNFNLTNAATKMSSKEILASRYEKQIPTKLSLGFRFSFQNCVFSMCLYRQILWLTEVLNLYWFGEKDTW